MRLISTARGTPSSPLPSGLQRRFIPAGAGNTTARLCGARRVSVYPRWRGEHEPSVNRPCHFLGLSPLARGTQSAILLVSKGMRFIPAGAGNTNRYANKQKLKSVYPRWRGEHAWRCWGATPESGLSPLARGTPIRQLGRLTSKRFIPAGAGNTWQGAFWRKDAAVYPRWRGEHMLINFNGWLPGGLSPLARGTRQFWVSR